MKPIFALYKALTVRFFRDKTALFFTVLLPVLFLLVFGSIFGGETTFNPSIVIVDNADNQFSQEFVKQINDSVFEVNEDPGKEERDDQLSRAELDMVVILDENFGAKGPSGNIILEYPESKADNARAAVSILDSYVNEINSQTTKYDPPIKVIEEPQSIAEFSQFDYMFAGLVAFSLMSLGVFGMANGFASDKKTGAIERLRNAPISAYHLVIATGLNYISLAFVSMAALMLTAITVFGFNMQGDWLSFIVILVLGTISMFGLGFAIAGWAKDEKQAAPISNVVAFPMMFLSGVFFPTFLMPDWLQQISRWLPLTPIADSMRLILMEGKNLMDILPEVGIIVLWSIIFYVVAFKVFRWR